jgi:hypothetical protein
MIYDSLKQAQKQARFDGDAVAVIELDHNTAPLFIRSRVLGDE